MLSDLAGYRCPSKVMALVRAEDDRGGGDEGEKGEAEKGVHATGRLV
jgi:hypothetical protein